MKQIPKLIFFASIFLVALFPSCSKNEENVNKDYLTSITQEEEILYLTVTVDANSLSSGGWTQTSENAWNFMHYDDVDFLYHHPISGICDDWLISPEITLEDLDCILKVEHQIEDVTNPDFYQIYFSTTYQEGIFNISEWQLYSLTTYPNNFANSNALTPVPHGTFRIGIRYHKSSDAIQSHRWYIKALNFYTKE